MEDMTKEGTLEKNNQTALALTMTHGQGGGQQQPHGHLAWQTEDELGQRPWQSPILRLRT